MDELEETQKDDRSDWEPLAGFRAIVTLPVLWGDMDAFQHVNNARHIRWFESSRVAYLERAGLREALLRRKWGPILAAIHCNYRRQIVYPDTVTVGSRVARLGRSSMTLEHRLVSHAHQQVAADGESIIVMFDYQLQRPVRISDEVRDAMQKYEGRTIQMQ